MTTRDTGERIRELVREARQRLADQSSITLGALARAAAREGAGDAVLAIERAAAAESISGETRAVLLTVSAAVRAAWGLTA